jgi:hypothetical protein
MTSHFVELVQASGLAVVLLWTLDRACQDVERRVRAWAARHREDLMAEPKPAHPLSDNAHVDLIRERMGDPPVLHVAVTIPDDPRGTRAAVVAQEVAEALAARRLFGNRRQGLA